jgi:uncharacterized membrane protein HdeD (DUF308 family)
MSHDLRAADTAADTDSSIDDLTKLYGLRFAFALVWAGLFAVSASSLTAISVALLVAYPLFDVASAMYDARSSRGSGPHRLLRLNMTLSLLAAIALAVAASSGIPSVLRVWGAWAIAAGAVQLVVAMRRRGLGGQVAMVLSGGISVVAGASFVLMAAGSAPSLTNLTGYAALRPPPFLVSAVRLRRVAVKTLQ